MVWTDSAQDSYSVATVRKACQRGCFPSLPLNSEVEVTKLLSFREAAAACSLSEPTLARAIAEGRGLAVTVLSNRKRLIAQDALEAWVASRTRAVPQVQA